MVGFILGTNIDVNDNVTSYKFMNPKTMKVSNVRTAKFNEQLADYPTAAERLDKMLRDEVVHKPKSTIIKCS